MNVNDGLTASQRNEMANDLDLDPLRDVGTVTQPDEADGTQRTFQHKTIARYRIGKFEFKNHLLSIRSERDYNEFIDLLRQQPAYERHGIVELNQRALQELESDPLRNNRVMLGATDSGRIDPNFRPGTTRTPAHNDLQGIAQSPQTAQQPATTEQPAEKPTGLDSLLKK